MSDLGLGGGEDVAVEDPPLPPPASSNRYLPAPAHRVFPDGLVREAGYFLCDQDRIVQEEVLGGNRGQQASISRVVSAFAASGWGDRRRRGNRGR